MSRAKGHDKAQTLRLENFHTVQFNLRMTPKRLEIIRLRITQAINRHASLTDLLDPARNEIDLLLKWNSEAVQALKEIKGE